MSTKKYYPGLHIIAAFIILLLLTGGNNTFSAEAHLHGEAQTKQNTTMKVKDLYDAFKKDETAAGEQYGGKTLTITGFVVYVGPDVYALPSVEISEKKGGKARALCVLPLSDYLKLRKVSKGDEVIIKGEVRGFYDKGDQVVVKQCVIQETK